MRMMLWHRILLVVTFALAYAGAASAQDIRQHEERKARLEREIAILDRQLADNADKSISPTIISGRTNFLPVEEPILLM